MSLLNKHVRLAVWPQPFRDIRDPRRALKYRRLRECLKVTK
jgi:hypothetical protein